VARPTDILYRLYEERLVKGLDRSRLPHHIGIILDGHRRYARSEGLPSYTESYRAGMRRFEEVLGWAEQLGIPVMTGWVLSKENLARPSEELDPYFDVLCELFGRLPELGHRHDLRIKFVGSLDLLPERVVEAARQAAAERAAGERKLNIAMGYGGRQEIVDAVQKLVSELAAEGVPGPQLAARIDADAIGRHMYAADVPDPDLLIRTSGESRLSGFMLWQSAYAEFAFVDVYWPDFRRVDFLRALREFTLSERRFGK
jgi:short-chain Z-isoprenyl diphosphate synthase